MTIKKIEQANFMVYGFRDSQGFYCKLIRRLFPFESCTSTDTTFLSTLKNRLDCDKKELPKYNSSLLFLPLVSVIKIVLSVCRSGITLWVPLRLNNFNGPLFCDAANK